MSGLNISFKIQAIDDFSDTMANLNSQTKKAFDTVGKLGAGMTIAGAGIAAGLGVAAKTAADFESAMSRVGALSGATDKDLSTLTQTAKDLGATTSFSASQAAEGMSYLAMAGYKTNDIIASMPGLLDAAAAGQTDLATTADITSNILSGFGLEAAETSRVADVLTKTFTSSNVDLAMLGETMKYVAPTAKAMGLSLEEVSAAAGILGNAGIQGSMAGTSLSMSLTRLASPAKEAAELMDELGFNAFDAEGNMLPLNKVLENLQKSTKDLTQEQKMHAISTIFGAESMKSMLTLLESGPSALSKFTGELEKSGGTAEEIAAKQLDNLNGQLTILKSGFEAAAISIGTALLPVIKMLASGIQSLVDRFNGLSEPMKTNVAVIAALTAGFLLLIGPILIVVAMIPAITTGFAAIAGAVGLASSTLLIVIGVVAGVVAALALIGVGLYVAYQKVEWFRDMVDAAWAWIKNAWNTALTFISGIVKKIMTDVSVFIGAQLTKIKTFWQQNGDNIKKIATVVFVAIYTAIRVHMALIQAVITVAWNVIKGVTVAVWGAIKGVISGLVDVILGIIRVFTSVLTGDWKGAWEGVKQITKGAIEVIGSIVKGMYNIGKNIVIGLINGIKGAAGKLMSTAKSIASSVTKTIKSAFDINSPSRVMNKEIGRWIPPGIADGILGSMDVVKKAAGSVVDAAIPKLPNISSPNYSAQQVATGGGSAPSITNNTPINVTLNYSGSASRDDAQEMLRFISEGLAKETRYEARLTGVKGV